MSKEIGGRGLSESNRISTFWHKGEWFNGLKHILAGVGAKYFSDIWD